MSTIKPPQELSTIQDFVRWGASRFNEAGLFFGHGTDNAIDEAVQLVLAALHLPPDMPLEYRDCRLTEAERDTVAGLLGRRIGERIPAAYLINRAWFAGLEFFVDESVIVPRSPLAELIEGGFEPWIDPERVSRVLDLCAGSGCIGLAVAEFLPHTEVDLADISPSALAVAARNRAKHGFEERVRVIESDLFAALDGQPYDIIISNPPYVGRAEWEGLPAEYHAEPRIALDAGDTGLEVVLRILTNAYEYLDDRGVLVMEVGNAAPKLEARFPRAHFVWLEFERGGEGVLLATRDQLQALAQEIAGASE